ncbi:LacI family DNA-binding transcriptional regulator [Microterricola pindariensis]|uniref:LacI family transcriptional regulator n=1 Tax=Microterricola pindariensis TaxID=478010 RepID=A0ABX5AZ86_9MICO|nr:LacI family DNA-binding transcriptional regulator [Microterricola pindariensis]PPL19961.1 LacI family transcriptional regulator [Microterricola pindariensis]
MAATLSDVAQLAGVSIKTVSNVIHDHPNIRPATKQRVLDAIAAVGYRPNLTARNLRSGRTGVISLVLPTLRNPYFAELAEAVIEAAEREGLSVLIEQSRGADAGARASTAQLVDGMLFSTLGSEAEDTGLYAQLPAGPHSPVDHVTMRNTEAIRAATEHLLALGRRRIVALGARPGDTSGAGSLRLLGYRQALAAAGLDSRPELERAVESWTRFDGAAATEALLNSGTPFDGIVAFNDALALGALRTLGQRGIRVPEQVSVIGFDDLDDARYSLPALTTISPGREQIATLAVQMLAERIAERGEPLPARTITVPFALVERESTAQASAD